MDERKQIAKQRRAINGMQQNIGDLIDVVERLAEKIAKQDEAIRRQASR